MNRRARAADLLPHFLAACPRIAVLAQPFESLSSLLPGHVLFGWRRGRSETSRTILLTSVFVRRSLGLRWLRQWIGQRRRRHAGAVREAVAGVLAPRPM